MRPSLRALVYIVVCGALVFSVASIRLWFVLQPVANAAIVVAVALYLRAFLDRRPVASLGFSFRSPWFGLFVLGAVIGIAMQTAIFLLDRAARFSHAQIGATLATTARELPLYAFVFAAAALAEEMPFRGYLLQNLWEEWGFWPAGIITALLFAGLHINNPHAHDQTIITMAVLLAYGLWTALTVKVTRSVWLALGSHFGWNFFEGPVFGFPVSGYGFASGSIVKQTVAGPALLTGGSYGPEGGLLALAVLLIAIIATFSMMSGRQFIAARRLRD